MTSPKVEETTSIDKLLINQGVIQPIEMINPDYSYGASQEPLNASFQVRNIPQPTPTVFNMKIGHFTITTTGSIVITGLWFTPNHIRLLANLSWGTWSISSDSITNWTTTHTTYQYNTTTVMRNYYNNTNLIFLEDCSSWVCQNMTWVLTSLDTDWFTINISNKTLAWTWDCTYIALW